MNVTLDLRLSKRTGTPTMVEVRLQFRKKAISIPEMKGVRLEEEKFHEDIDVGITTGVRSGAINLERQERGCWRRVVGEADHPSSTTQCKHIPTTFDACLKIPHSSSK
jgi:hypothetical protein